MQTNVILSLLLLLVINSTFVFGGSPSLSGQRCEFNSLPIPLYHAFSPQFADDFYTTSISEMESTLELSSFEGEGIIGLMFATQETGTIPLYRVFNPDMIDHSYTPDLSEVQYFESIGYDMQDIVGYVFLSAICDAIPLYRMQNEQTSHHICAISSTEMDSAATEEYSFEAKTKEASSQILAKALFMPPSSNFLRNAITRRSLHATSIPTVKITNLPNNIRVATEATPGHFASSTKHKTEEEMTQAVHSLGGQIFCSSARENVIYQSSNFLKSTENALKLLSEAALEPQFTLEELEMQREAARYEIREINTKPEMIIPEILHEAAFGSRGLGNPLLCPEHRIDVVNGDMIRRYMAEWYRPERMVVAGAGMLHEELVEWTDKYFSRLKPTATVTNMATMTNQGRTPSFRNTAPNVSPHLVPPPTSAGSLYKTLSRAASSYLPFTTPQLPDPTAEIIHPTQYVGGHHFIYRDDLEFNHLYLAFESVGIHDPDVYAVAIMQVLLGGGGSFSAGGPGKGMYSRLYTHILNYHPQIDHCASFHHIYTDTSLFGLFASFLPSTPPKSANENQAYYAGSTPSQILPHLTHQLSLLLYQDVPHVELNRAKNQLKSSLMMALESRAVEVEDLGRQVLVHNRKIPVTEMCDHIDLVTPTDLRRVAARIFGPGVQGIPGKKATVVTMGNEDVYNWENTLRKYGVGE
ncbi:hypothetical protein Clacol_007519 [Clathrus columnatus]|uniref:Mitochondrial processing peptidase alpha subunit n=1 Tax=Clathrus columnatus TaxID=1419009 RepID=A0AAV5AJI5_9AGAM|nr:hypothetical protein Clacol_007519 [Clathrus columnatus]